MRRAAAAGALLILLAQQSGAAMAHDMTLILPHPIRAGETAWIEVRVGPIRRGQEVEVTTPSGQLLGVISPFGVRSGHEAGTYLLPVPHDAIRDDRVAIRLTISQAGEPPRNVTATEVRSVKVVVTAARP